MLFGLKNPPAVFQPFINEIFEGIFSVFVFRYIDNIIVFPSNLETHLNHTAEVLQRLRKAGFYTKLEKCEFCISFLDFLGHRISTKGIIMNPKEISSILEWPATTSAEKVQQFLELVNYYRRFISNFAKIVQSLVSFVKKFITLIWSKEVQEAFNLIKSKISFVPVLAYPDRYLPFMVETDNSNFAIGEVLS